jgi:hypothetical protein
MQGVLKHANPGRSLRFALLVSLALSVFWLVLSATVRAEPLSITGPEGEFVLSQEDILAISNQELITATPWTDGNHAFRGAPLAAVLERAGIQRGWVNARGLNHYSINLPLNKVLASHAFLAVHMNGELMRIKDKGPFWIIFPWNDHSELLTRDVRSWSVWQLQSLRALD